MARPVVLLACICLAAGCGSGGEPATVSGQITFNGKPLESGAIRFFPVEGTPGWGAVANIEAGKYTIAYEKELLAGKYEINVTAERKTGRRIANPEAEPGEARVVEEYVQFIPEKYNVRSTLRVDVKAGKSEHDFALEE